MDERMKEMAVKSTAHALGAGMPAVLVHGIPAGLRGLGQRPGGAV